ncbi:hypothetical protein [Methylobacterium crusticola]|uniref:hypothetical protein n=1 Tax=Methylobacterium crusticola TaxID=1697972 RepID=UPI000FFB6402
MQAVLDQPVVAPERHQGLGSGLLGREAGDRAGGLVADPVGLLAGPLDPADLCGAGPAEMGHACAADAQAPRLDAAVPLLDERRAEFREVTRWTTHPCHPEQRLDEATHVPGVSLA